ncbi:hypothetical protein AYI70_g4920 [Smittium culicis]|uniref:Uncharacterized protein n=1 Tax=Smittium culicis TaxID=133412 RepID=A0A1R1XX46_9FUNG|nr:hypothetical protein AYI70_g7794 [Smittium culicis]OMJ19136.1 hypothetical protein AYI70_g4920 [Smittium culicis]
MLWESSNKPQRCSENKQEHKLTTALKPPPTIKRIPKSRGLVSTLADNAGESYEDVIFQELRPSNGIFKYYY